MNCWLSLQVYLPLQVGLILREVLGPALREKASLIRNSNDQILVIFSCSIYFYNKNENGFLSLNSTKVNWYICDLWFTWYYRQIPKEERILLWKYVCSVGCRVNTGLHNEKKYDPEVSFVRISGTMKIIIQLFYLFHIALGCFTVYRTHLIFKGIPINNSIWSLRNSNLCILNIAYINKPT